MTVPIRYGNLYLMERKQTSIPLPPPGRHMGVMERILWMAGYCIFALVTGAVMGAANILLTTCEVLMEYALSLINVPTQVDNIIIAQNAALECRAGLDESFIEKDPQPPTTGDTNERN